MPLWVRGSNLLDVCQIYFGVGQIVFGVGQSFWGVCQSFFGVGQNFFGESQIVPKSSLKQVGFFYSCLESSLKISKNFLELQGLFISKCRKIQKKFTKQNVFSCTVFFLENKRQWNKIQ